jgi:membrane-associated protease RseP (regulator of RpoE activity)
MVRRAPVQDPSMVAAHAPAALLAIVASLTLCGCVTVANVDSDGALSAAPSYEEAPLAAAPDATPFTGLELEEAIAGSLENLEFLGGLRVASVAAGSPAEAAGVHVGDRVVRAAGVALERLDQWSALLSKAKVGAPIVLAIEKNGGVSDVTVAPVARAASGRPPARRFVERRKARVVVETEELVVDGAPRTVARVVELDERSPLREADVHAGDALLALDGVALNGAADFARRVSAMPFGARVELDVLTGESRREVTLHLFEPERKVVSFRLWPLVGWSHSADDARGGFELLDLWLIWLVKYERTGETRHYNVLRLLDWQTGVGALTEEHEHVTTPPAGSGR